MASGERRKGERRAGVIVVRQTCVQGGALGVEARGEPVAHEGVEPVAARVG